MKVAVVGSREFTNYSFLRSKLDFLLCNIKTPITIVSGGAKGVDTLAHLYAVERNFEFILHLPDYDKYPAKVAPLKRNELIVDDADIMVAFPKGESRGTRHALSLASKKGIKKRIIEV